MGRALIFTGQNMDRVFIRHLLEDFSDNSLSKYFYVDYISPEKADRDYYRVNVGASPAMDADKKFEPGFQGRVFLVMMNSYLRDEFHYYNLDDTSLRIGITSDRQIRDFKKCLGLLPELDKSSYRKVDLFAGKKYSPFADFRAEISGQGASLFIHRKNTLDETAGYLMPFLSDDHRIVHIAESIELLVKEEARRGY